MSANDKPQGSSPLECPHAEPCATVLSQLESSALGISPHEASHRLKHWGPNHLPEAAGPNLVRIFMRQFKSPLIYVLLLAGVLSLVIQAYSDAVFIFMVLFLNAAIGLFQEYRAEKSALALRSLVATRAQVVRGGEVLDINAHDLVPGDIVLLESGGKVPADLRLIDAHNLTVDESVLTGESLAATKSANALLPLDTPLADRANMIFAGSLINAGRARGVVTATGPHTELGKIASTVLGRAPAKAPLIIRMEKFTHRITIAIGVVGALLVGVSVAQGADLTTMLLLAVALAVSAIPEGLPVALTVALAVGMERMAKRGVIVRRLVAVEALGSCTYIASDKTGTLTVNQLTVRQIQFPGLPAWDVSGEGLDPSGQIIASHTVPMHQAQQLIEGLARAVVLANEAVLSHSETQWVGHGDSVDLAFLVFAHKTGMTRANCLAQAPELSSIPYESERRFSASLNEVQGTPVAFVKGSLETIMPMCSSMTTAHGSVAIDRAAIDEQAQVLASQGFRVLAVASGPVAQRPATQQTDEQVTRYDEFNHGDLINLRLLGLLALSDPPRPEAKSAIARCRQAGIRVAMVTGDHPLTALAVAREVGLATNIAEVATGAELGGAIDQGQEQFDALCRATRVFARVEPQQKLQIVQSLQRQGHFVAVTGDGANDAPALRAAQVGVAMGKRGTDVAKETSDVVITDDNFASIVTGVEQGRIAYANVRKVVFLLISTGSAEVILFALALISGLPMPLLAVQLLWLNLVTNGIQDIALAFDPAEGRELRQPPRPPKQGVFDRVMLERVILSAVTMAVVGFANYYYCLAMGMAVEQARNLVLLLMVLFENLHTFNSRSETQSVFRMNPARNRFLLFSVLAAQALHLAAMYTPGIRDILGLAPVPWTHWLAMLGVAASLVLANEAYKAVRRKKSDGWGIPA